MPAGAGLDRAGRTRDLLPHHGIDCPTITGAGTGSFEFEGASGVRTEVQCGSYIFMDADYGRNRDCDDAPTRPSSRASSSGRR
jgi:3-hydroxy-D-aspartate aldolase